MSNIDKLMQEQEELYRVCVDVNNCCLCPCNNGNFNRDCELTLISRKIEEEIAKKRKYSYLVTWHADGYCGSFLYNIVTESEKLEKVKEAWEEYVSKNDSLNYSWSKAKKGERNHFGGYIEWKEQGLTDKEPGFYELSFSYFRDKSDHLND